MSKQKTKARTAEKDALTLLKEDHDNVRELLAKLEESEGNSRLATLRTIEQELKVHTKNLLSGFPRGGGKGRGYRALLRGARGAPRGGSGAAGDHGD